MIFFESWQELFRVAVSALLVYVFIVVGIRFMGKRSTAQMNNFDWIVTVALGSIVGSAIILKDVVLVEVFLAMGLLLGLQYAVTKAAVRWNVVSRSVRAPPTLLFYGGIFHEEVMFKERVTRSEIEGAAREAGYSDLSSVQAVILESSAKLSILGKNSDPMGLLDNVERTLPDDT